MIKIKLNKSIINILGAAALSSVATQAGATLVAFDGGAAGSTESVTDSNTKNSWSFAFGQNLGWNHTSSYHDLVVSGGTGTIQITDSETQTTDAMPGFTIWHKIDGTATGHINGSHQYDQVSGPTATGTNSFLVGSVDYLVGYGNAGNTFTNANGNAVGHGGIGGTVSGSYTSGVDSNGLAYVTLTLNGLAPGDYYILDGGSDYNNTSGKTTGHNLITATAVNAVPVPSAVWLFGSAIAGMVGWSRRKFVA